MRQDKALGLLFAPGEQEPDLPRYRALQRLWKALPLPRAVRGAVTSLFYQRSKRAQAMAALETALGPYKSLRPKPPRDIRRGQIVLSGYLSDTSGIGRGGRMSRDAFLLAGLQPILHDLRREPGGWAPDRELGVWFAHCNAPEAAEFLLRCEQPRHAYRIGYWAWELPNLPAEWAHVAALFHEIWTPSQFVADSIRRGAPGLRALIRVVPHPLPPVASIQPHRRRFGMPDGVFVFLCMYDVHSSATRKNPRGAIEAFQLAFAADRSDVRLVVKVVGAAESRRCLDELMALASGWPNINFLTEMLDDPGADRLIASADAFVSLHRSEGFGLSIAQAMALERPVIVTGWSGNVDFCGEGAANIGYSLVPVEDPHGVYDIYATPDQVWAEPDLSAAALAMRAFAADPAAARALGVAARRHVEAVLPRGYDVRSLRRWLI